MPAVTAPITTRMAVSAAMTFTVVSCFQYGFVNQTVAEPFVFVGLHFG